MLNIQTMIKSAREALGWPYVCPGSNDAQGIDCSGLFVKMYRDQGASIYHGSNTIFHEYCSETGKLSGTSGLCPGMAVFKLKAWTDADKGNRWYNKPPGNLSHIGFVASVRPLQIIHASSAAGCVTIDDKIKNWAYWGRLKDVNYGKGENTMPDNENPPTEVQTAVVYAENGGDVKMRAKPSTSCSQYTEVPSGTMVTVLKYGNDWSKIQCGSRTGYMMTEFLKIDGEGGISPSPSGNTVTVSSDELTKAYQLLEGCLKQFIVSKSDIEKAYDIIGDMLGLRG